MPANDHKVIDIILEEMEEMEEIANRCPGYSEELTEAIEDIIAAERQHRVKGTNIQQQVNDICDSVGRFLNNHRKNS